MLGAARRVDDELREHFAFDVRRPQHVRDTAAPDCPGTATTCFSTWNSKYVWFVVDRRCGVPPTTPLAIPPATPLPVKSASFVTFLDRSMSGRTSGILIGAVSTWKPFGGGAS